jgi:Uma2 family endonuclease
MKELVIEARSNPFWLWTRVHAMSTAMPAVRRLRIGPRSAGLLLTTAEFDHARFREGWRYELINGVLVVSPTPSRQERHPNEELGYLLRNYQEGHPQGTSLDLTLHEETIEGKQNRRRADRAIWAGLGRDPKEGEAPTIVVEFVSHGKVSQERDYVAKRAEYREIGVREYWIIDRFRRTLTVFTFSGESDQKRVIPENQNYTTPLRTGFELPLGRLLKLADRWAKKRR